MQASADEVYAVWKDEKGKSIPAPDNYAFQKLVPILDDGVVEDQELAALSVVTDSVAAQRNSITDRWTAAYTAMWLAAATYAIYRARGWRDDPITIDGPFK